MRINLRAAAAGRLRVTAWAVALCALSTPVSIPLFASTIVAVPLIGVFGAGIPLVLGLVWLTRQYADVHRWVFARAAGVHIRRPYRRWPGELSWTVTSPATARQVLRKLPVLARDPATWRDLLWLPVNGTIGLAAYVLVIVLAGGTVWYAFLPLLWWILARAGGAQTAEDVLRTDLGFWAIENQATALVSFPVAGAFLLLWWSLGPAVLRAYARLSAALLGPTRGASLAARVHQLTESRAEAVDTSAAALRRIERDLHDGAQARLVSLGMSLGLAEELLRTDPERAARLLAEAQADSQLALAELRNLVRGVHPPVLADRGLAGAVAALALAHPLAVEVEDLLPGRPAAPVESAAYFAVAEALTNVTKHARATVARVRLAHQDGTLLVTVSDDGRGGAAVASGGGLEGMIRRLSAFDGSVTLTSPSGGPTVVFMEIPCELSSAKTTPS